MAEPTQKELIRETVKELFKELGPVLQSIALTPEKLREAQKPYEDPAELARELREQQNWRRQENEKDKIKLERQSHCPHKDKNGKWAISLVHNYHDHMPRGICPLCEAFIHPAYWDYRPVAQPDGSIKDEGYIVKEHPLYHVVRTLESF
jgi:hypothetical protein